jgi:hypothetical protein
MAILYRGHLHRAFSSTNFDLAPRLRELGHHRSCDKPPWLVLGLATGLALLVDMARGISQHVGAQARFHASVDRFGSPLRV